MHLWNPFNLHLYSLLPIAHLLYTSLAASPPQPKPETPWTGYGGNTNNNRWASTNTIINSSNIKSAQIHCQIPYKGGVSSTASILSNIAYFPAWNGSLVALDYTTCRIKWQINVQSLVTAFSPSTPIQENLIAAASRTTPQIDPVNKILYFASLRFSLVFAADLDTGKILATKQIHTHPLSQITQSPSLHLPSSTLYLGVASSEESIVSFDPTTPNNNTHPAYTFIGTAVALRITLTPRKPNQPGSLPTVKFTTLWTRQTLPFDDERGDGQWSGAALWGSQPSIDTARNQVYYATGNIYDLPDSYLPCTANPSLCSLPDRVWQESVIAFDMTTGRPNWVRTLGPLDAWTVACITPPINTDLCVGTPGADADFGMAPVFVPKGGKNGKDVLVVGQKSGNLYALSASTGTVEWATKGGPTAFAGGGGIVWGVAVDDSRVYFNEANSDHVAWKPGPEPKKGKPDTRKTVTGGAYGAADLKTGSILWQTADGGKNGNFTTSSPPTVVGDVVIAGRQNYLGPGGTFVPEGALVALKKDTGEVLLNLTLDSYHLATVAVAGKYLLFGTGHHVAFDGSFYVLKVPV